MATEKILIFDEAGNAKRMKVRIARFLDNEPVTASDKENIRTTLDVDDSLSGTFTTPLSVTSASDSSFTGGGNVGIGTDSPDAPIDCSGSTDNTEYAHFSNNNQRHLKLSSYDVGGNTNAGHDINASSSVGALSLSTGGTQRVTIDSSGNVTVNGGRLTVERTGSDAAFALNRTDAKEYRIYVDSNSQLMFRDQSAGSTRFKITATGDVNVGAGNLVIGTSGKGIDFGSGATLDEYEEGYHTVTATPTTSGSVTLSTGANTFTYTKIGNIVSVSGTVIVSSVSSPVGGLWLSLPVGSVTLTSSAGLVGGSVYYQDSGTGNFVKPFRIQANALIEILMDASTLAANDRFGLNVTYRTTAS